MTKSDYEKFQDQMFTEIGALERQHQQWVVQQFVNIGKSTGVNVISEVLDRGRSVADVFHDIQEKQKK